ncbi:41247_t:CDS:1, partial [Gigaspora margarita]
IEPMVSEQKFSELSQSSALSIETPINSPDLSSKKRTSDSTEKSPNKKAKKVGGKKVSSTLKQLIEELLTNIPIVGRSLEETSYTTDTRSIFLQLSDKIDSAESKNKDASRALISSYFDFGEALFNQYKELKPTYGKEGARALVKSEVRKEISKTKLSEDALQKRMERAQKMHRIFNTIGKEKIVHIVSTPPGFILNLTGDDTNYMIAE